MAQQPSSAAWVKLPAAVVLVACEFLDAASLGRLEICGKSSLGDKTRAWSEKAAGVARGTLAQLSNKRLLAAQARVQELIPSSAGGVVGFANNVRRWSEEVPFDEFAFTVVLSSESDGFQTTVFPFMRLVADRNEMGAYNNVASFVLFPSGQGADNMSPLMRDASLACAEGTQLDTFKDVHMPRAYMICTRKADGAAVKVAFWDTDDVDEDDWAAMAYDQDSSECTVRFDYGELMIGHGSSQDYQYHMTLNIMFDRRTSQVLAFCSGIYHSTPDLSGSNMSNEMFLALLHARLDESMRARPLPVSEVGSRILNHEHPTSQTAADVASSYGVI